jgi:phosphohistidine phosphatase SixA
MNVKRYLPPLSFVLPLIAVVVLAVVVFDPPELPDLSEGRPDTIANVLDSWQLGNAIVLVRHLERCDRSDAPCLDGEDGITARSVGVGMALGEDFLQLGLGRAVVYNSPLARTDQTADVLFGGYSSDRDWLYHCRKNETLLNDIMHFKQPGTNLVLVTHSTCIARFEQSLGFSSDTPDYGTAIFLDMDVGVKRPQVLGFLNAQDWEKIHGDAESLLIP